METPPPRRNENGNTVMRIALTACASALITGISCWLTMAGESPSKRDVENMIRVQTCSPERVREIVATSSPYVMERAMLLKKLDEMSARIDDIAKGLLELERQQARLLGRLERVLGEK